jgi:hypothetical protein
MAGAIGLVVFLVIAVPVGVMAGGALWSAAFGWVFNDEHEPSSSSPTDA